MFIGLSGAVYAKEASFNVAVKGAVKQPLYLNQEDLAKFQQLTVRLNEITQDGKYNGVFIYTGIPLRTILNLAVIEKKNAEFNKLHDLAVVVRNKDGKQVVLSWGEIFYRNPSDLILALSARPLIPHKSCNSCHKPGEFEGRFNQLERAIGFPKLIAVNDFYTDRAIEDVVSIEVVDLKPALKVAKPVSLFSPDFIITGAVSKPLTITDIANLPQTYVTTKSVGDGIGYHGIKKYSGISLTSLLEKAGVTKSPDAVCLVTAPDGYRSLLSFGELFLSPAGSRILIADRMSGEPLTKDGRFLLLITDDQAADRWVKAVNQIEIINLQ